MVRGYVNDVKHLINPSTRPKTLEGVKDQEEKEFKEFVNKNYIPNNAQPEAKIKSSTTEGRLYFVAVDTLDRLDIQFVPDLDISRKPNIASLQAIGQNTPKYHYLNGETNIRLPLDFYAMDEDRRDVINKCRWLEHLTFNDRSNRPVQRVKLIFGDLFRNELWIVRSCSYKLGNFNREKGFLPQQAYVNLSLSLDSDDNLGWEDVRSDGGNPHLGAAKKLARSDVFDNVSQNESNFV